MLLYTRRAGSSPQSTPLERNIGYVRSECDCNRPAFKVRPLKFSEIHTYAHNGQQEMFNAHLPTQKGLDLELFRFFKIQDMQKYQANKRVKNHVKNFWCDYSTNACFYPEYFDAGKVGAGGGRLGNWGMTRLSIRKPTCKSVCCHFPVRKRTLKPWAPLLWLFEFGKVVLD